MTSTRVSIREELIFLLNQATELEHSLCCSYLFTSFSLKSSIEDGLSTETVGVVRRWKRAFLSIAIEEMFHLAVINDLLVALGSAPNFDRPNFPHGCSYYMPDLAIEIRRFDEAALRHFAAVEQPTGGDLPLLSNAKVAKPVVGDLDNEIGPDPYRLVSQGDVYGIVLDGLREMCARMGEQNVFIGPPPTTAIRNFLESSGWTPIRSLASAELALAHVVEQGEGGTVAGPNSHHSKFMAILDEFEALRQTDPNFEPAFPVLANPFTRTPPEAHGEVNIIDDELAIQISDLFNEIYSAMLQLIARFFVTSTETDAESTALVDASIEVMSGAVVPLGELLVRLPAGASHPGLNAGPSFVVGTLHPLPYKEAAWKLLHERFGELRDYAGKLAVSGNHGQTLVKVGDTLSRIVGILERDAVS